MTIVWVSSGSDPLDRFYAETVDLEAPTGDVLRSEDLLSEGAVLEGGGEEEAK